MTDAEFVSLYKKSITKQLFTGTLLIAFGLFIVWLIFSGSNATIDKFGLVGWIILWLLATICMVSGVVGIFIPLKNIFQLKKGSNLLINAIEKNDETYIIWCYEYVTHSKGKLTSAHQIWAIAKDGKRYTLAIKKSRIEPILIYFKAKFPTAYFGFSKEILTEIDQKLKLLKQHK